MRRIASDRYHLASVYLIEGGDLNAAKCLTDLSPRRRRRQLEVTGREEMSGNGVEGPALQSQAALRLGPVERFGESWQRHIRSPQMEIIGTGIDATEISRIAAAIERYGDRFVKRIFTDEEVAYFCRPVRRQGSGDESTRDRVLPRCVLARDRSRSTERPSADTISWRRSRQTRVTGRDRLPPDTHPFQRYGDRPRPPRARISLRCDLVTT